MLHHRRRQASATESPKPMRATSTPTTAFVFLAFKK
jgi:hypothetical protein